MPKRYYIFFVIWSRAVHLC